MSLIAECTLDAHTPATAVLRLARQFSRAVAAAHGNARRRQASMPATGLLDWSQKHLPHYFRTAASRMHTWLAARLDQLSRSRAEKMNDECRMMNDECRAASPIHHSSFITHPSSLPNQFPNPEIPKSPTPRPSSLIPRPRLNLLAPRGAAKSTLATLAFVLKAALEKIEPYIWIVSDTKHQACAHLESIKAELVDNPSLARCYPDAVAAGRTWRNNRITLRNGVTIEAFGTGQRIRGRRHRENRPTLIVCDDLQNDGHILSRTQRQRSRSWFHGTLMKAGTPGTTVVNLATALHRDALAMELHHNPGWTSGVFRSIVRWPDNMSLWQQWEAIYTDPSRSRLPSGTSDAPNNPPPVQVPPGRRDLLPPTAARPFYEEHRTEMDAGAVLLWPEREDLYTLMCMRVDDGHSTFEREKQNSPIDPELCEWPENYFDEKIWFDVWPATLLVKTMALDPSKGTGSRYGDFSAFVSLGVDCQGIIYVEADLSRRSVPEIISDGVERFRQFRPHVFAIEANQFQDLFTGLFEIEFRRLGLLAARPLPIENQAPKQVRIRRLGPYLSTRRLRFKSDSPGTKLLVEQLMQFPIADHDDGPDALEMALRLADEFLIVRNVNDGLGNRLTVG